MCLMKSRTLAKEAYAVFKALVNVDQLNVVLNVVHFF